MLTDQSTNAYLDLDLLDVAKRASKRKDGSRNLADPQASLSSIPDGERALFNLERTLDDEA